MESASLTGSAAAELSVEISLFSSSISFIASICRPIRAFSPDFLFPFSGIPIAPQQLELTHSRAPHYARIFRIRILLALFEIPPPPAALLLGCSTSSPTSAVEIACPEVQAAHG